MAHSRRRLGLCAGFALLAFLACNNSPKPTTQVVPSINDGSTSMTESASVEPRTSASSVASVVPSAAATTAGVDSGLPKQLNGHCAPRVLGPDPGKTPVTKAHVDLDDEPGSPAQDECVKHADCKERPHGRCVRVPGYTPHSHGRRRPIPTQNYCYYDECQSDAECRRVGTAEPKKDLVCWCRPDDQNHCDFANCRADSDCPAPYTCGGPQYCHAAADECQSNADCKSLKNCVYSWDVRHYVCQTPPVPRPG